LSRILITSGPTRQYIDPVRFISNASSGQMGACLADAALALGHEVVIVSGPVQVAYPREAELVWVTTTEEMLAVANEVFERCDGVIGAAAPCDYRPVEVAHHKLRKTGEPLILKLVETPDVLASLGQAKRLDQWAVGFALETEDARFRALAKLERKSCDLMILNGVSAINSVSNEVEIFAPNGDTVRKVVGDKADVARQILEVIQVQLIDKPN
jgi:phosphopantothenoylcysteine decarboxylase/phosphopantothenate--cysteine ligase